MTRTTDHQGKASKPETPNPQGHDEQIGVENPVTKTFWGEMMEIVTKEYWVEIFTSDDGFMKGLKWGYIMLGLFLVMFVTLGLIPQLLGY